MFGAEIVVERPVAEHVIGRSEDRGGDRTDRCASRAAAISYGSVLHAKLTPWIGSADQASIGSGMTKIGMVRLAK